MRNTNRVLIPLAALGLSSFLGEAANAGPERLDLHSGVPYQVYNPASAAGPEVNGKDTAFITDNGEVRQIDSEGNIVRTLSLPPNSVLGLGFDTQRNSLVASNDFGRIWTYNLDSAGGWQYLGETGLINSVRDIAVTGDHIAVLNESGQDANHYLELFNRKTLAHESSILLSGSVGTSRRFKGLGADKSTGRLYLSSENSGIHLHGFNVTPDLTSLMDVAEVEITSQSIAFPERIYGVGASDGNLSFVGSTKSGSFSNYFGTITPEPSTLALAATGALAALGRRKR